MAELWSLDYNCWEKISAWIQAADLFRLYKCGDPRIQSRLYKSQLGLDFYVNNAAYFDTKQVYHCIYTYFNNSASLRFVIDDNLMPSAHHMSDGMLSLLMAYASLAPVKNREFPKKLLIRSLVCTTVDTLGDNKSAYLFSLLALHCAARYQLPCLSTIYVDPTLDHIESNLFALRPIVTQCSNLFRKAPLTDVTLPVSLICRSDKKWKTRHVGKQLSSLHVEGRSDDNYPPTIVLDEKYALPSDKLVLWLVRGIDRQMLSSLPSTLVILTLEPFYRDDEFSVTYSTLSPLLKELSLGGGIKLALDIPLRSNLSVLDVAEMKDVGNNFSPSTLPKGLVFISANLLLPCDYETDQNWWHYWPEQLEIDQCNAPTAVALLPILLNHVDHKPCNYSLMSLVLKSSRHNRTSLLIRNSKPNTNILITAIMDWLINWSEPILPMALDFGWIVGITNLHVLDAHYVPPTRNLIVNKITLNILGKPWSEGDPSQIERMARRLAYIFPNIEHLHLTAQTNTWRHYKSNHYNVLRYEDISNLANSINPEFLAQTARGRDDSNVSDEETCQTTNETKSRSEQFEGEQKKSTYYVHHRDDLFDDRSSDRSDNEYPALLDDRSSDGTDNEYPPLLHEYQYDDGKDLTLVNPASDDSVSDRYTSDGEPDTNVWNASRKVGTFDLDVEPPTVRELRLYEEIMSDEDDSNNLLLDTNQFSSSSSNEVDSDDSLCNEESSENSSDEATSHSSEVEFSSLSYFFEQKQPTSSLQERDNGATSSKMEPSNAKLSNSKAKSSFKARIQAILARHRHQGGDLSIYDKSQGKATIAFVQAYLLLQPLATSIHIHTSTDTPSFNFAKLRASLPSSLSSLSICPFSIDDDNSSRLVPSRLVSLTTLSIMLDRIEWNNNQFTKFIKSLPLTLRHLSIDRGETIDFVGTLLDVANILPPNLRSMSLVAFGMARSQYLSTVHMFCHIKSRQFMSMVLLTRLMDGKLLQETVIPFFYAALNPM